jgi:hypothetical protein
VQNRSFSAVGRRLPCHCPSLIGLISGSSGSGKLCFR